MMDLLIEEPEQPDNPDHTPGFHWVLNLDDMDLRKSHDRDYVVDQIAEVMGVIMEGERQRS